MKSINIRQTEEKSKVGNYREIRNQLKESQLEITKKKQIKSVDEINSSLTKI